MRKREKSGFDLFRDGYEFMYEWVVVGKIGYILLEKVMKDLGFEELYMVWCCKRILIFLFMEIEFIKLI